MIGDTFETKYFGTYEEKKDTDKPAEEIEGTVIVNKHTGSAFLYVGETRYDLPSFMAQFDRQSVAILGRKWVKHIQDKQYNKLVVISAKALGQAKPVWHMPKESIYAIESKVRKIASLENEEPDKVFKEKVLADLDAKLYETTRYFMLKG